MICFVIRRLYVHNFRCLENFELNLAGMPSVLLIGRNGSGKTAVALALEILQKIGRGTTQVRDLVGPKDFSRDRSDVPMRFEIEAIVDSKVHVYSIAFELPQEGKELLVLDEKLEVDGGIVYTRDASEGALRVNRSLVALPIIQLRKYRPPGAFKEWLGLAVILRPIPDLMPGEFKGETREPHPWCTNFSGWFAGVLGSRPSAYARLDEHLKQIMLDLGDIQRSKDLRGLIVQFSNGQANMTLPFEDLSSGEKCFMICALLLAANHAYGPLLCFWDEPDNYLALDEVQHFIMALRSEFQKTGGQFIATSHNPEVIRAFSDETTLVLQRKSHLEPTVVRKLSDLHVHGDLVDAITRGDLGE